VAMVFSDMEVVLMVCVASLGNKKKQWHILQYQHPLSLKIQQLCKGKLAQQVLCCMVMPVHTLAIIQQEHWHPLGSQSYHSLPIHLTWPYLLYPVGQDERSIVW
jgi:hypothetical protein